MNPLRLLDRLKYLLERQLIKGVGFQLLVVMVFILLVSLTGGLLVYRDPAFGSAGDSIWWAFLRLTDPGYLGDDQGPWKRVISTLLTLAGYVLFMGTLVAIMTQWLIARWRDLERGLTPVAMKHHVVVLGWSNRTLPLVRELMSTRGRMRRFLQHHGARRLQLVIMDDNIALEQHHALKRDGMVAPRLRDIVLRSGSPMNVEHLSRAACHTAAAIILPSAFQGPQTLINEDVETIKALLSLRSHANQGRRPYVVAELQDARHTQVAHRAYPEQLEVITGDDYVGRLLAQTVRRPGLARVYRELMTQSPGQKLYVRHLPQLLGKRPSELRRHFDQAVFCGILPKSQTAALTLDEQHLLAPGDQVLLLSGDYKHTEPQSARPNSSSFSVARQQRQPTASAPPTRILILGWNRKVLTFLSELRTHQPAQASITVLSTTDPLLRRTLTEAVLEGQSQVACRHVQGDYTFVSELAAQRPEAFEQIILFGSDRLASGAQADARTMVGQLCLESLLEHHPRRPHIIVELNDADNEAIMTHQHHEVILSPILVSHLLAQVALKRELKRVYDELFTAGGANIVFRDLEQSGLASPVTLRRLADQLWQQGDVLLGLYQEAAGPQAAQLRLNTLSEDEWPSSPGLRLVVMRYPSAEAASH